MRRIHLSCLAAALAVSVVTACDDSSDPVNPPPADDAALRVINGAAAPVSVTVDGQVAVASLAAGGLSERLGVDVGTHTVQLRLAGGGAASQQVTFNAREGRSYIVSASADQSGLAADVDTGATPIPNRSKLRIIHAAANAPALDVWRTQPDFQTPIRVMFPFPFGAKSSFMESDPGEWEVWVTPEGATSPKLATSGPIPLEGGWVRTIFLLDAPNGGLRIVNDGEQ